MTSLARIKSATLRLATNLRGWKTRRKLLVIESDDWGAIRMPGRQAWERLLSRRHPCRSLALRQPGLFGEPRRLSGPDERD